MTNPDSTNLTPWFPVKTPPARVGEYDYRGPGLDECRLLWNGYCFGHYLGSNWVHMADSDGDKWRGLASDPKARHG